MGGTCINNIQKSSCSSSRNYMQQYNWGVVLVVGLETLRKTYNSYLQDTGETNISILDPRLNKLFV